MGPVHWLSTSAPEAFPPVHNKPVLLVSWWCTFYALSVIFIRVSGRYIRAEKLFREDAIMMLAIIPLFVRMGLAHVVLLHGTNNVVTTGLSLYDIQQREVGSQVVLAARIMYTAYLWTIKFSFSIFLRSLTASIWQKSHQKLLKWLHIILAATFVCCVISDLAPCEPFSHNWQVVPDPGSRCRQGYFHLLTNGFMNVATNIMLVVFPIPMILRSRLSTKQKITILIRMAIPFLNVGMTAYQLYRVTLANGAQPIRTLLASFDILLVTFTSNAVALASLLQDRGYKKSKYKYVQELQVATRTQIQRQEWADSDENLMRDNKMVKVGTQVIGMQVLKKKSEKDKEVERDVLSPPPGARLQDIRVATTWEISIENNDRTRQLLQSDI